MQPPSVRSLAFFRSIDRASARPRSARLVARFRSVSPLTSVVRARRRRERVRARRAIFVARLLCARSLSLARLRAERRERQTLLRAGRSRSAFLHANCRQKPLSFGRRCIGAIEPAAKWARACSPNVQPLHVREQKGLSGARQKESRL